MGVDEETQAGSTLNLWPFQRDESQGNNGTTMMAALAELRDRVHKLEEADREKSAAIDAHRQEISELKSIANEARMKFDAVLAKLDLGFANVTALIQGERNGSNPFSGFR
jgi:hypothetical protein